ncbi:MAG: NACHT domain-containing protein [Acidobacteriota bacterium]
MALEAFLRAYRLVFADAFDRWAPVYDDGVPLAAVYVSPRLGEGSGGEAHGEALPVEALLHRTRPLVLRGAAGSGKTTWLRWAFHRLLRHDEALPVLLRLGDVSRRRQIEDWHATDWTFEQAAESTLLTHRPDAAGRLPKLLAAPPRGLTIVLLIDGWDSLDDTGDQLRRKLSNYLARHPQVRIAASSRPFGQDQPAHGDSFDVLDLQPFNDGEIAALITRFCRWCHPEDGDASTRLRAHFADTLLARAEQLDLVRRPGLLGTLLRAGRSQPLPRDLLGLLGTCTDELLRARCMPWSQTGAAAERSDDAAAPDPDVEANTFDSVRPWRPASASGRQAATSAFACKLLTLYAEEAQRGQIDLYRPWGNAAALLPAAWPAAQRSGFLRWLAASGALDTRADASVAFSHGRLLTYWSARHLDATLHGQAVADGFLDRLDDRVWWSTLQTWALLLDARDPSAVDGVLQALIDAGDEGLMLTGLLLAQGVGSERVEPVWRDAWRAQLEHGWSDDARMVADAWAAHANDVTDAGYAARRGRLGGSLRETARSLPWLSRQRVAHFIGRSGLSATGSGHGDGDAAIGTSQAFEAYAHLDRAGGDLDPAAASARLSDDVIALGRVLCALVPLWPGPITTAGLLQLWPGHRRLLGLRMQTAALCGAPRSILPRLLRATLVPPEPDAPHRRNFSFYLIRFFARLRPIRLDARRPDRRLGRAFESYFGHYVAPHLDTYLGRDWSQDFDSLLMPWRAPDGGLPTTDLDLPALPGSTAARAFSLALACDSQRAPAQAFARHVGANLGIAPTTSWLTGFARAEVYAFGRAAAPNVLALGKAIDNPYAALLRRACRIAHGYAGAASLEPFLNDPVITGGDPLWPALARHLAGASRSEDRALLTDLVGHPEKRRPPLATALRFIARGDVLLDSGEIVTLDELADEADVTLPPLLPASGGLLGD